MIEDNFGIKEGVKDPVGIKIWPILKETEDPEMNMTPERLRAQQCLSLNPIIKPSVSLPFVAPVFPLHCGLRSFSFHGLTLNTLPVMIFAMDAFP